MKTLLYQEESLVPKLYQLLATAIEILDADKGNIQFYDERENILKIVAHIGFNDEFLREFKIVTPGFCACGTVLERGERVIVEDTAKDDSFNALGSTLQRFGFSAVQATPLFDESGNFFGVLSTHFKKPGRPCEEDLQMLDEYLKRAAPAISSKQTHSV